MNDFTILKTEERDFSEGRDYIGASDMGALAGIDKYKTPYKLWAKLTNTVTEERDPCLEEKATWGHALEPNVIWMFLAQRYGATLADKWMQSRIKGSSKHKMANGVIVHSFTEARCPQFDKGVAHADCLVVEPDTYLNETGEMVEGETYLIEAKTTTLFNKRDVDPRYGYDFSLDTDKAIPLGVYLQVQWQMLCYGVFKTYTCCLMGGQAWKVFGPSIYAPKIAEKLLAKAQKMWRHVEAKEAVQPKDFEDVCHMFPHVEGKTSQVVNAEVEAEAMAKVLRAAKLSEKIKKYEAEIDEIKAGFGIAIGGKNYLEASDGTKLATQINSSFEELNGKAYLEDHPDIDKKYFRTQTRRYILVAKPPKKQED